MTTKRPTVTAKVTTTTATKTSTRSRRTTAAKKEDAKKEALELGTEVTGVDAPEEKKEVPPAKAKAKADEKHQDETETVDLADEDDFDFTDEDELIATEVGALKDDRLGDANYTIGSGSFSVEAVDGNSNGQYQLGIWVRDSKTLTGLSMSAAERINNGNARGTDYAILDYADQNSIMNDPHMMSFFARDGAKWNNFLPVGARKLRNSKVNYSAASAAGNTERIVSIAMRKLNLGMPLIVRLWHSGIVFSINPPSKDECIALVDALQEAHLDTLRRTNGLIHGTSSFYANRLIVNEFMKHVTASNIDRSLWPDIMNHMDHRDIQFMAWGIKSSSNIRGYKLVEKCGGLKPVLDGDGKEVLNSEGKVRKSICGHVNESIIDWNLVCQIDDSMFTEWQRNFIARKIEENAPVPIEDIIKYQSEGGMHQEDTVEITEDFSIVLKAPKASLHIEIGERWINSVEKAVNQIININSDDVTKNNYINRQLEATSALDVAHWVKAFEIDGEIVSDREGIERVFRSLGNNMELRDEIFDKIRSRMSKRLAAVVAIPTFKCPSCGNLSNEVQHNGTVFYTPLDMVSRFFTLTARSR